jgi:hypothetical protein
MKKKTKVATKLMKTKIYSTNKREERKIKKIVIKKGKK